MKLFLTAIIFSIFYLSGCDTFYSIPLNTNSDTLNVKFECGKVDITLQNWQGHVFDFYQNYKLENSVKLYVDSLTIRYKGRMIPCHFVDDESKVIVVEGKKQIRTAFRIDDKIKKGDTITVIPDGYIYCNDNKLNLDSLQLIMTEDLINPMEN
ncbi:MAG: hypothetical protein Q8940_19490 [Bacteroidota bacterium]|nr:hypothetical protein [Bacteroidota bacterium]